MRFKYFIVIFLFAVPSFLFSKNTIITGSAKGYEGLKIQLSCYDDLISYKEKTLASQQIDENGNFRLVFDISTTTYAMLQLDFKVSEFYIIPGSFYDIKIRKAKDNNARVNTFLTQGNLDFEIIHAPEEDINPLMQELNLLFNTFIGNSDNFNALYRNRDKTKIREFVDTINNNFPDIANDYFKNAIKYKLASLEDLSRIYSKNKIFEKYFARQTILYNNIEYMSFFNEFFTNYLISSKLIKFDDIFDAIEQRHDYYYLLDLIGKDTLLKNEVLREMVMLKGLKDLANNPDFTRSKIIKILGDFSRKSNFEKHRVIAKNIVDVLTRLQPGTAAPDFTLKDLKGDIIHLKDYRGKYVYLCFWTSWCSSCTKEFKLLSEFYTKYENDVKFLGISVDKEYTGMYHYLNENKLPWPNYHFDNDLKLIDDYGIRTYPLFVLIGRDGKIIRYPAPGPSQNLDSFLEKLLITEN